jgi:ubiquinone/menaquinone biosynthesis C-methylase UbiE
MSNQPSAPPNPGAIMEELNAYQRTAALRGAIDLELFTHIDDGAVTARELAQRTGASERGLRILCDFLTVRGILTKHDGAYGLTSTAKTFLSKRSPAYLGSMSNFLARSAHLRQYEDVAAVVRKGGSIGPEAPLDPDNPMWVEFARSMAGMMGMMSKEVAGVLQRTRKSPPRKVLDIAAGHGMYGIAVAQAFPTARIVGQDWKNVLEVALENARKAGVADRYKTLPGSAFDVDFGSGYDLILLPNFCHHFDVPTNIALLKKIHAALEPGGQIAIVEFIPNEDRITPPLAAAFAFTMLNATPAGDVYTFAQYQQMLSDTGFSSIALHEFGPAPQRMVTALA